MKTKTYLSTSLKQCYTKTTKRRNLGETIMSFSDYLKNRESAFQTVTESLKKDVQSDVRQGDDNVWKPQMGTDGTGYAVVRFLPGKDINKTPWIKLFSHGFQGPTGKWFIENSLTTLGQKDPVSEYNSVLWNNGTEAGKEQARKQKRRTNYYANVLVLKDPLDPSSEGKVKIFRFGQKIFDKVMNALQPEFADETPLNPFDLIEGANFRIKIKTVAGYWNYDASEFEKPSPLSEDETRLEQVFNAQHDVHALIAPDQFKSYDELKDHLYTVLELTGGSAPTQREPAERQPLPTAETSNSEADFSEVFKETTTETSSTNEDDDLEDYFKSLAS